MFQNKPRSGDKKIKTKASTMSAQEKRVALLPQRMGFFSWDLSTDKLYGDHVVAGFFGFEPNSLVEGLPILPLVQRIAEDDRSRVAQSIHHAILSGDIYREAYRVEHEGGQYSDVVAVGRCIRDASGVPSFYVGTVIDAFDVEIFVESDPLKAHCRSALALAEARGNDLAARYLSSALRAVGGLAPNAP